MASTFPGAIDNFTDPLSNSSLASPSHAGQHSDLNDAVEKIETYMGLVKVIPTGATNGTVAANGTVTIGNAVSSVTVSGAFSSLYDNYEITVTGGLTSASAVWQLAFGAATTEYYGTWYFDLYTGAGTGQIRRSNGANLAIGNTGGTVDGRGQIKAFVASPFRSERTTVTGLNYGAGYSGWFGGEQFTTTSFTAFTLSVSSGTMTGGTIRVYGYRN